MSVTVDDQPLPADRLGLKTVGQVLRHLRREGSRRVVVHVLIDGKEPDLHRLKTVKRFPVATHSIFIETADPRQMADQVLYAVEAELSEADRLQSESAALLKRKQIAPAIEKLGGCFTSWQHVQESIVKTAQLLRIDLDCVNVHGKSLSDLLGDFTAHLRRIRAALEERDFPGLMEMLAQQTTGASSQWRAAVASLRGAILSL